MKNQITILLTLLTLVSIYYLADGQTLKTTKEDLYEPLDFSYMNKWVEFELKDTIDIIILDHFPAPLVCGIFASASITYGLTNDQDTIRIKDLCNILDGYNKGVKIKVAPATAPTFDVVLPLPKFDVESRKIIPNHWDINVIRTTWGSLD